MNTLPGTTQSSTTPTNGAGDTGDTGNGSRTATNAPSTGLAHAPQTYGSYLRVPDLLALQTSLSDPPRHDEMLFIIVQQVQELWFKQILFEFELAIRLMDEGDLFEAARLVRRVNMIMKLLADEVGVLETMAPSEFLHFRGILSTASGFESEQFRELEYASGLREPTFLNILDKHMDGNAVRERWPLSVRGAFLGTLSTVNADPSEALLEVYADPGRHPQHTMLAESLSEYELIFQTWRFAHLKLVERVIGSRTQGTAGSMGSGYLARTLSYRFFPELWETRNRLSDTFGNHKA